jgi:hypothetical protein
VTTQARLHRLSPGPHQARRSRRPALSVPALDHPRLRDVSLSRERLEKLAHLLDTAFRIPGTSIRFGLDAALNVVPGAGTLVAKGLAAYLIVEAARLGLPRETILRMVSHVGIDFVISAIPLVGWVGDLFFKANSRNMSLLRDFLDREHAVLRAA